MMALSLFSGIASAADVQIANLSAFQQIVNSQSGVIFKITVVVATLAGLILIVKGLVHLKQNYTGSGQEKHMSKGIASLGFGTALILAVPLSHALVGSVNSQTTFETGAGTVDFSAANSG